MQLIDRKSVIDAQRQIEEFIPNRETREPIIDFLAEMIIYANGLNRSNWNLNLDRTGNFLRFNTGQEYCIQISSQDTLVLCLKQSLIKSLPEKDMDIEFLGYSGKEKKLSRSLQDISDCLVKVPGSVGCLIKHDNIKEYLPFLREANIKFIDIAMTKTTILTQMKNAHSSGSIEYLSKTTNKTIPNPIYENDEQESERLRRKIIAKAKRLTDMELETQIAELPANPKKTNNASSQYIRNIYVSEFIKRQAKGVCQDCFNAAPFYIKNTDEPYLETHHIIPLSLGGKDVIENVIALCPNCHRKRHYG